MPGSCYSIHAGLMLYNSCWAHVTQSMLGTCYTIQAGLILYNSCRAHVIQSMPGSCYTIHAGLVLYNPCPAYVIQSMPGSCYPCWAYVIRSMPSSCSYRAHVIQFMPRSIGIETLICHGKIEPKMFYAISRTNLIIVNEKAGATFVKGAKVRN